MRAAVRTPKGLREEIPKAAARFLKRHRTDAPVDEIIKAAGLTSGALYSHLQEKGTLS